MVSKLANRPYNPATVERSAVETATEEAIAAAIQDRPVLPASRPTAPVSPVENSDLSHSSTATGSKSATPSINSQDAALILEQQTAMSDSNSRKRSAEEHPKNVTLSAPAAPPDPPRNKE